MSAAPAVFHALAIPSASVVRTVVAVAAVAAVALFLTVAAVWGNPELLRWFLVLPIKSSTFMGRLLYARDVLPVIFTHPLGLGYQGYLYLQGSFQTGVYQTRFVHNELLQTLVDVGWLPAGLLAAAAVQAFRRGDVKRRAALILLLGYALFDFDFQFPVIFCVVLNQRTGRMRKESNEAGAKIGSSPTVCPFVH